MYEAECNYFECGGGSAIAVAAAAHGACMMNPNCAYEGCVPGADWNLPAASVEARTVADVQAAVRFANTYSLSVSIKTTGHNYAGASTMKGSLLVWMANFQTYNTVAPFTDSCGTLTADSIKVGGGTVWGDVYVALGDAYHIVGGGTMTVGAAGGWLQGGGLSAMSRLYGCARRGECEPAPSAAQDLATTPEHAHRHL